jgi:uncharacterized protein YbjT (DUF2867 family)
MEKESLMKKTAIVIGATGLVGRALVDQLADAVHIGKVITLTRRPAEHSSSKVFNHVVDFDYLENYSELFNGDYLFSCLGTTRKQAGSIAAQRVVDLDYQYTAAKIATERGVDHYLLVSSSGANEHSKSPYLKMKGELEEKVKILPFKRISLFQPSLLIGQRAEFRLAEKVGHWLMVTLCILPWLRRFRPITGEQVSAKMVLESQQSDPSMVVFRLDELF